MYYAISLNKEQQAALWRVYSQFFESIPEDWEAKMDHITLIHSSHKDWAIVSRMLSLFEGHTVEFQVTGIGFGEGVVAFKVSIPTTNEVSHITIGVAPYHSAKESNDIEQWSRLYCAETFSGRVTLLD